MAFPKLVIALMGAGSMFAASPVNAAESAASRLSLTKTSDMSLQRSSAPAGAKSSNFKGDSALWIILLIAGLGGLIAAASSGNGNGGGPGSP